MRSEAIVFQELLEWAQGHEAVRALLLTSSRAHPGAPVDLLSDFDIEVFVRDLRPYMIDDSWLETFGSVLISWPAEPTSFVPGWITRLVLFEDRTRIDFQVSTTPSLDQLRGESSLKPEYDNGFVVLLDKDGVLADANRPTYAGFHLTQPTAEEFATLVHDFWWEMTYVAKSLWRDELFFAKYMFDCQVRFNYLEKAIEWTIGLQHGWNANPNNHGRWFKRYLDPALWAEVETTFAGPSVEENWRALFQTIKLFRRLAIDASERLGYAYPEELDSKLTEHFKWIRGLGPNGAD